MLHLLFYFSIAPLTGSRPTSSHIWPAPGAAKVIVIIGMSYLSYLSYDFY